MSIDLLGPLRVDGSDAALQRRDQVVLCALAVRCGEVMTADQLAEAVWGDAPPPSWAKVVQGSVLRIRRAFGSRLIETMPGGYRLVAIGDDLDTHRFVQLIERGRLLASAGEPERAATSFERALALWRGTPFDVLDGWPPGRIEVARLDELRRSAEESLLDARLDAGEHRDVAAIAEARVAEEPLREHRWAILALAQYRCGRQADALRSLRRARCALVEQLGIEPGAELVALEAAMLRQDDSLVAAPELPASADECPYKGLAPYDVDDTDAFFGRDADVVACLERMRDNPLLVVTGPSGCGKSSLVRAGLVPSLKQSGRAVAVFVPGGDPESALTSALASAGAAAVVVVDQFEEVFALDEPGSRAREFCARLAIHARDVAPVIIAVRADHVASLATDGAFALLAGHGMHLVAPLAGESLRQAIEGPAALAGVRLEPGLIDLLLRDSEGEPGALPLLSHALAETWRRRDGRTLTVEGYRATGEIRGAVARSADRLYESLPAEQRPKLRSMLLRLVSPSTDGEPVRSRIATRSLGGDPDRERVLGLLVRARLVTAEADSVELAHEALARAWPRLRSWLDEDAAGQRTLRHLSTAADGWESLGRPATELYRGARLDAALEWREATSPDLTDVEWAFLDASVAEAASEREAFAQRARVQAQQNKRLRRSLAGVAILLVAALVGGLLAYQQRQTAQQQRQVAEAEQRGAALTALTSNSAALRRSRRDLAALLAVEAHRMAPGAATESALFGTFTASPGLERVVHTDLALPGLNVDVAILPDGQTLAVGNGEGGVELFDAASGERTRLPGPGHGQPAGFTNLAVAAEGSAIATVWHPASFYEAPPEDGYAMLTVWDGESRRPRFDSVRIPDGAVRFAISPDGSLIAASTPVIGRTRIYDGGTGELVREIEPLTRPDEADSPNSTAPVAFRADGSLLVGSMAGPLRIVDPVDGSEIARVDAPQLTTNYLLWVGDGGSSAVTLGFGGHASLGFDAEVTVTTFDLDGLERIRTEPLDANCNNLTFAEQIGALLCGSWEGRVLAYDVHAGSELGVRFDSQQGPVCGMSVSADGTRLFELTSCTDGNASIAEWRLDGGGPISTLVVDSPYPSYPIGFEFAGDDGAFVVEFATGPDEPPVTHVLDLSDEHIVDRFPGVYAMVPTADPNVVVAIFAEDGTIGRYDVSRHEAVGPRVDPGFEIGGLWLNGDRVLVKGGDNGEQLVGVDLDAGRVVGPTIDGGDDFQMWVVEPADDALYTMIWDNVRAEHRVQRRDRETGDVTAESPAGFRNIVADGDLVIASTNSGRIFQVDPKTLEPVGPPFPGTNGPASEIALDAGAHVLMVRGDDETLRFYDVETRTPLGDPIDLDKFFIESGALLAPDGRAAAAVTGQGIVVWDLNPEQWDEAACQLAGRNLTHAEWEQYIGDLAPYRRTCPEFPEG